MNSREHFLKAAACEPCPRPPVWIMRQAGRYLPEYRELKKRYDFTTLVQTPELAAEVSLQPLKRFNLDASIIFSDILVVPEALGRPYGFKEGAGIHLEPLRTIRELEAMPSPASAVRERLDYLSQSISLLRENLGKSKALIGFAGAPWTLAAYLLEGRSSKKFERLGLVARQQPAFFKRLMGILSEAVAAVLCLQIEAGADVVQIFDSHASLCSDENYQSHSLNWIKKVIDKLPPQTPVIVFAKGMHQHMASIAQMGASVLGVDANASLATLAEARMAALPAAEGAKVAKIALQGNLEPDLLGTDVQNVRRATNELLESMRGHHGYIFNLGHGILPSAKIECVEALVETVVNFK